MTTLDRQDHVPLTALSTWAWLLYTRTRYLCKDVLVFNDVLVRC